MGNGESRRVNFDRVDSSMNPQYDEIHIQENSWSVFQWLLTIGTFCSSVCALFVVIIFAGWVVVNHRRIV